MAITKGKLAVYSGATAAVATPSGLLISRELEHTQTINNLNGEVTLLNQNIKEKDGQLESKDQELKKDKAESGALYEDITRQSEEISRYTLKIERLEEEVEGLKDVVDEQSKITSDLTEKADDLEKENKQLKEKNNLLEREQHHMDEIYSRGLEGQTTLEQQKEILTREIESLKQRAKDIEEMTRETESKSKGFIIAMLRDESVTGIRDIGVQLNKKAQEFANCDAKKDCKVDGMGGEDGKRLIDQSK